jgi:putative hydrolase of the HAD superfamily
MTLNGNGIKGIVFDVDGTLYYQWPVRIYIVSLLIASHLLDLPRLLRVLKVIRRYREIQELLRKPDEDAPGGPERQVALTAERTGESSSFVEEVVGEWMERRPLPVLRCFMRTGSDAFIREAHAHGYKVGAYSDYPCRAKLEWMNVASYFSCAVSSFDRDVLAFKPHKKGFLVCADRLGLNPEEILYIGDRENVDGVGAERSGMRLALVGRGDGRSGRYPRYGSFATLRKAILGPS